MPIAILMFLLLLPAQSWAGWLWGQAEEEPAQVQVTEPYVGWRTGPATGYPVFHTSEKGEWLMMGEFDGAAVTAGYGGFWMTRNLSAELWASQILGSASEIRMVNANLVHQPFPHWRVSPFFTLGVGHIWVDPKATLAQPEERDNSIGHAGLGIRAYITDRYFIRAEVKDYKVFTTRSTNEEATEWKIGLSIFF